MEKLLAEIIAQRLMLNQLVAFTAAQEADVSLFVANYREAALRSLDATRIAGDQDVARHVHEEAARLIEESCDLIGQMTDNA